MLIGSQKKALLHVAKAQLHMVDEDYRAVLERSAGVQSASQLDETGFARVMAEFERLGFRSTKSRTQGSRREGMASPAQVGRIRSMWHDYTGRDNDLALGRWLETHFHVSNVRFLDATRASKAVAVLVKMCAKKRAKLRAGGGA